MAAAKIFPSGTIDNAPRASSIAGEHFLGDHGVESILHKQELIRESCSVGRLSLDELLLKMTRVICEKYKIDLAQLSTIQRIFLTHYRCNQCGLLPLYHINLLHVKRVRCRKCGQLICFKRTGKYGKLRKDIAFELTKEIQVYVGSFAQ
ncbi:MAG: hypothetical protein ACRD5H_16380 [Nitrososphaerales archaeon]